VACGQNPEEQAEALYELVMLEAGRNRMASARNVADQAVAVCPHSTVLRRIQIALSKGDADIVRQSREASPADPEIWLAYLAATARDEGPGAWAMAEVRKATSENACSPGTMVRAGHFLLSHGMTNAACEAARYASRTGRGFLPADVLALRCAVATGDRKWMLSSAMDGAEDALEPWPFYKTIVALKNIEGAMDPDTLRAIEALAVRYPDEKYWAERLGSLYFQRGETERALEVLDAVLQRGTVSVAAPTMIIAAEAARLEGKLGKAVRILESAHSMYPDNASVLNNLIYCLAQDTRTLPRARELVDKLLRISGSSFAALDTAAVVYLRSGEVAKAEELMNRALKLAGKNDYAWAELNLNAAEIQIALGRYEQAQRSLKLLRAEQVSALVDSRAKEMLADIEGAIRSSYERRR
jgi:tetratricopeptide (TPR) repeat protein